MGQPSAKIDGSAEPAGPYSFGVFRRWFVNKIQLEIRIPTR
jgi:hypothetical protein